ncbi:hypothetical protein F5884DRAFT_187042 [Xylogone sp. PMI_703]|nr:hypothetical protein F5884DRAFT_187042 [Xylogone sp. PMI_703]
MTSQRDPRVDAYVTGNKKWASSEEFKPPIYFSQIQERTRNSSEGQCYIDCGMAYITDEEIRQSLRSRIPDDAPEKKEIDALSFGGISDPEETVKEDVAFLKASPYFKGMQIYGFVHNLHTGLLKEII